MNEWFAPQISEHCPKNRPIRFGVTNTWLIRPGRASTFAPREGIAQEWITSADEIIKRVEDWIGIFIVSVVFINREMREFSINISVSLSSISLLFDNSEDQNHWCPIIFMEIWGCFVSSIKYRVLREGKAMNRRRATGKRVQIVSICCPSERNLLIFLFLISKVIK